jgi:hypothetical protein
MVKDRMITDRFPELERLDPQEKLILAGELWRDATRPGADDPELPEAAIEAIEARLAAYLAHPDSGISWTDLKRRLLGGTDR